MFGVHRSSYKYWRSRAKKIDAAEVDLRAKIKAAHRASQGSAGVRTVADILTNSMDTPLSRYRASKLMKNLGLVSCQVPNHKYKRHRMSILKSLII